MKVKTPHTLPPEQRKKLRAMIDKDGLEVTRQRFGISRHALERAVGAMNVQVGTLALLTQKLSEG